MKRALIAVLVLSAAGAVGTATAGCTSENRGGAAGGYDTGYVSFGDVEIYAEQYGSFAGGPAFLCSDGQAGMDTAARGRLEITVDGELVCANGQRLSTDPFGFGAGIHSPTTDECGAEVSWDGIMAVFLPNAEDVVAGAEGADVALRKTTTAAGTFWYGGTTYEVPAGSAGYFTRGVRVASEH